MQYRPTLKIQSQIFNESHFDMHTEVQVFLYPKITGKKSEKFAFVKICYDFQSIISTTQNKTNLSGCDISICATWETHAKR